MSRKIFSCYLGRRRGKPGLHPRRRAALPAQGPPGPDEGRRVPKTGQGAARLRRGGVPALRLRLAQGGPRGRVRGHVGDQAARVQGGRHPREPGGGAAVGLGEAVGGGRGGHGLLPQVQQAGQDAEVAEDLHALRE